MKQDLEKQALAKLDEAARIGPTAALTVPAKS